MSLNIDGTNIIYTYMQKKESLLDTSIKTKIKKPTFCYRTYTFDINHNIPRPTTSPAPNNAMLPPVLPFNKLASNVRA